MQQYFQKMQNRCQMSPDTRPLKRSQQRRGESRQSGGTDKNLSSTVLYPDVYPQQEKQEEDNLQPERLNRGYQIEVVHSSLVRHEYDSLIKSSRIFMNEDQFYRTARWIKQLMQKKSELNTIWLDKNWIKENTVRNFSDGFRVEFFESLISGRRIQKDNKRHSLATCFPRFLRTNYDQFTSLAQQKSVPLCEAINLLYDKGVPIQKAIWFLKMNQIAHPILVTLSKKKGTSVSNDDYASDMRQFFIRYLRCLLKEYDKAIPGQLEQNPYYQRWPYIAALIKHSFEDGMLDRHEFLLDMCELLAEFSNFTIEQPQTFRILIILMTQFTDLITQNVFIARRIGYILCNRLAQYKRDYEKMRSTTQISQNSTSTNSCFIEDLINCQHHRPTLLIIFGFLHAIIADCPSALIWTPFEPAELLEGSQKSSKQLRAAEKENAIQSVAWLCGSPLDHLPCSIELTTAHLTMPVKGKINKILDERIREITERSSFIESHWAYINPSNDQSGIESIVENCLDILSMLDTVPLDQPKAIQILFDNIFSNETNESTTNTNSSQMSIDIRVRMLINWAVTSEREGTHRALIVTKLLKMLSENNERIGPSTKTIHELLVTCLNLDCSNLFKNDEKNKKNSSANMEFANLMLLFYELQRFDLFNHDQYVRKINGAFYQQSLYERLKLMKIQNPIEQLLQKSTKVQEQMPTKPPESQMIISFIPTTPSISSSANSNLQQQKPEDFAKLMDDTFSDNHAFMDSSIELSFHERFLLHLPIEQRETNRDICNQRSIMLYGISELREQAKQELRKLAREICKIWKKMSVEILNQSPNSPVRELRFRHRCTNEQIVDVMNRFQAQTYYDQLIITGWCAESFIDLIEEFLRCLRIQTNEKSSQILPPFPTYECLDILCEMMNLCMNIHSLITFTAELLPFLIEIEEILHQRNQHDFYINCIPGSLTAQLAYVLISQLAIHFNYFLYSPEACSIFNNLYLLIKNELQTTSMESTEPLILTGWSRGIAMFLLHGRDKLLSAELNIREGGNFIPIFDAFDELLALLPANGIGSLSPKLQYKSFPLVDQFNPHQPNLHHLRFFPFDKMKICLQSMQNEHAKYSFVQDAFKAACRCGHDYERLVELANFCAHVSCQLRMETEWCNAIQELCCSNVSSNNSNWNEMLLDVDSNNFSTHYPLSTFVLLLCSKYAISSNALIDRLISNVFNAVIREEGGLSNDNFEHGICLAIYICASLICGTDIPFNCTEITPKGDAIRRKDCNQNAIRIGHIAELGTIIFPLLTVILQFVDELKKKVDASKKDHPKTMRSFSQQMSIARCALLSMCEQEWVIQQMFELADQEMDSFINSARLKNKNLGEQLLRISLRRKNERLVKQELMECTDITIFDKLLSNLNIWNMRATYFDFKLTVNQNFPESPGNQINSYYHHTMFVFNNIANALHQLFLSQLTTSSKECFDEKENISAKNFRPSSINCFWLIAPLVNAMPTPPPPPPNLIQTNYPFCCSWQTSAMKAYFLKIVCENLKTAPENNNKDGKNKSQKSQNEQLKYEQLFAYQPFLNLVMACTEGENVKQLLDTLLDFVDDIVTRVRKNPIIPHQSAFLPEREGLILRLNLLTGLFDHLATNANAESWASVLYQLLLFEVLTSENDTDYFDTCLDMLIILCHKMYPHRTYTTFASKFKNLRIPDDLYCLQQLLPIPKSQAELTAWDYFFNSTGKSAPPQVNVGGKGSSSTANSQQNQSQNQSNLQMTKSPPKGLIPGIIVDKQFESVEKKILRMIKHDHWIQKNTDLNGKISLSFIERPGLPGEDKIRSDPFLSPPEMEQVPIIQEIGDEQKMTQEMDKQEQKYQHQSQQRQQMPSQHSILEQQQNAQQMRAFHHQQPPQQQGIPTPQQTAQHHQFQQMLQHQQMMTTGGHPIATGMAGEPIPSSSAGLGGGQIPPQFSAPPSFLNLAPHGSGSSTPAATDSPVRPQGIGRGGRRKSQAGSNQIAGTTTGAGRGQKRKKEAAKASQMMGGNNAGMEMFSATNPNGNGKTMAMMGGAGPLAAGGQPSQQMSMGHQTMMQMQALQWQQQQQMQRQQQQQGTAQQPITMGRAPPMMFNQQPTPQQPSQQFRQQPQPPPQYQPPQQHQPVPGRPSAPQFGGQQHQMPPQMPMGMMGPGGQSTMAAGIGTQQPQMSDFKKQLNARLKNRQAQQQQQQQHPPGMGSMGMMPPGP